MKKITKALTLAALAATLAVSTQAADGGIIDVDTRLNVRTDASISSSVKAQLWDGQVVTLHEKRGAWWYTEYAPDTYGYVHGDYVDELNLKTATVTTASTNLNVRESPSATAKIKDKLQKGESVLILGTYGSFYKVLYDGNRVGYASSAYLTVQSGNVTRRAITLSMPSYKQYNYPSLYLPGSGESVATHGCAVTSLAMTESFRTGKTVTPRTVIANEKFTSNGALYWPSEYSPSGGSLEYIYNKLAEGKPVIVHAKKSNGTAHFAVVYGFSGGELTAANFKLSDPGSIYRTTLAALYKEYPIRVKMLSY